MQHSRFKTPFHWCVLFSSLVATTAAHAASSRIESVELSTGYDGKPINVTQTFRPTDRTIHATVKLNRVSTGDKVKAIWFVLDAGGLRNYRLTDKTQSTNRMNMIHFVTTMKAPWPRGKYRVDLYLNGQRQRVVSFTVR